MKAASTTTLLSEDAENHWIRHPVTPEAIPASAVAVGSATSSTARKRKTRPRRRPEWQDVSVDLAALPDSAGESLPHSVHVTELGSSTYHDPTSPHTSGISPASPTDPGQLPGKHADRSDDHHVSPLNSISTLIGPDATPPWQHTAMQPHALYQCHQESQEQQRHQESRDRHHHRHPLQHSQAPFFPRFDSEVHAAVCAQERHQQQQHLLQHQLSSIPPVYSENALVAEQPTSSHNCQPPPHHSCPSTQHALYSRYHPAPSQQHIPASTPADDEGPRNGERLPMQYMRHPFGPAAPGGLHRLHRLLRPLRRPQTNPAAPPLVGSEPAQQLLLVPEHAQQLPGASDAPGSSRSRGVEDHADSALIAPLQCQSHSHANQVPAGRVSHKLPPLPVAQQDLRSRRHSHTGASVDHTLDLAELDSIQHPQDLRRPGPLLQPLAHAPEAGAGASHQRSHSYSSAVPLAPLIAQPAPAGPCHDRAAAGNACSAEAADMHDVSLRLQQVLTLCMSRCNCSLSDSNHPDLSLSCIAPKLMWSRRLGITAIARGGGELHAADLSQDHFHSVQLHLLFFYF